MIKNALTETGFLRVWHIVGSSKTKPPITPIFPVSRSTWLKWVDEGKAPPPVKLSERTTAWIAREVQALKQAHIAGKSTEEIKRLVLDMEAARKQSNASEAA